MSSDRRLVAVAATVATCALVAACSDSSPSALRPKGRGADRIAGLWWFLLWAAVAVTVAVVVLLAVAVLRRRREKAEGEDRSLALVIGGGVVLPVLVLPVVFVLTARTMAQSSDRQRAARMQIEVVGHRWWWEVRYPDGAVTANEIHIPTGEPVRVALRSDDINHSLWVPELQGKTDLVPGYTNVMWLEARRPGVYRGQCAEFCGVQHAHMAFVVVADSPDRFAAWLDNERGPAAPPPDAHLLAGQQAFLRNPCVGCHTIRGTAATATIGPDLTHFASRSSIGALTIPNNAGNLAGWIENAQNAKPGSLMPPMSLDPGDLQAILDYLETLR